MFFTLVTNVLAFFKKLPGPKMIRHFFTAIIARTVFFSMKRINNVEEVDLLSYPPFPTLSISSSAPPPECLTALYALPKR
jgi:hypothetical protein